MNTTTAAQVSQDALKAAFDAAVDAEYPIPDNPHASVILRATDNRAAMWRGIMAAQKILSAAKSPAIETPAASNRDLSASGLLKLWKQAEESATDTMPAPFQFAKLLLEA
jgi:hypothetical protein